MRYILHILNVITNLILWVHWRDLMAEIESLALSVYPDEMAPKVFVEIVQTVIMITAVFYIRIAMNFYLLIEKHYDKQRNKSGRQNNDSSSARREKNSL